MHKTTPDNILAAPQAAATRATQGIGTHAVPTVAYVAQGISTHATPTAARAASPATRAAPSHKTAPRTILAAVIITLLAGCAGGAPMPMVGPRIDPAVGARNMPWEGVRLDVIVPIFTPGIPENPDEYESEGIWPELRRAESNRFAMTLKEELGETGVFGDVYVTPSAEATGDLYVLGAITESNGEDLVIEVNVVDIAGNTWMTRSYEHRVREHFWQDPRKQGEDPYRPVFQQVADDVAALVRERQRDALASLRRIAELRFAGTFSGESFSKYLAQDGSMFTLTALPDRDDPMLVRTRAIRVQDGLFMDRMQQHYAAFVQRTNSSYHVWQEHSMLATKGRREAERAAFWEGLAGAGLALAGAAAVVAGVASNSPAASVGAVAGGAAAMVGGFSLLESSFKNSAEGDVHAGVLSELGQSLNIEVAPQNIELEGTTAELTGDANEQFRQWRTFLQKIYAAERVPDTKIDLR